MTSQLYRVPPSASGERLDHHLAGVFPDLSRSRVKALIEGGCVCVNGHPEKASRRLKGGEEIALIIPEPVSPIPEPEDLPLHILYEDEDLAVVDKAAGMVVHPGAGNWRGTVVNALLFHLRGLSGVGGTLRPGLVHRLDKGTSGCLVVAKNDRALVELQKAFKSRRVNKIYLALVHGEPPKQGKLNAPIARDPVHRQRFTARTNRGKSAATDFSVLERLVEVALVEVRLHTGRTHQVRVHLSQAGYPLLGDALYGGLRRGSAQVREIQRALGRPALHAWKLQFIHPRTQTPMQFQAAIPADFQKALECLRIPRS